MHKKILKNLFVIYNILYSNKFFYYFNYKLVNKNKVNIKARIDRHTRILTDNISFKEKIINILNNNFFWYKIIILFMIFIVPIYPIFASFIHKNNEYAFYRWYVDESSILWSYFSDTKRWEYLTEKYEVEESDFKVTSMLWDERDILWQNEITEYIISKWDNYSILADKYRVSKKSIMDSNHFDSNHILKPWDKIIIPPVTGIVHTVKKWETLEKISKIYSIWKDKILTQNLLVDWEDINVGDKLVIPWWVRQYEKKKVVAKTYTKTKNSNSGWYSFRKPSGSQYVNKQWSYKLTVKPKYHTFYWGNCTWYVAKYKTVNWGWNANMWLKNAQAKWRTTWQTPVLWAIVVLDGRWYNPRYGHVAIVMDIKWDSIIVSDMNYRRLNEVTYRKISKKDRAIKGYIYWE